MSTEFSELISPSTLTLELSFILIMLISLIAYTGIKYRSGLIFTFWTFDIIVLILIFTLSINFIWFWGMIIISIFVITFVGIVEDLL